MKKMPVCTSLLLAAMILLGACGRNVPPPENSAVPARSSKIFDLPYVARELDNGLRVIVVPTDYPEIVSMQIPVQSGSRNEVEPGKSGFAHFFEHMMFRGTEAYPADVYTDILKQAGADGGGYTTNDYTNYHLLFTKNDLEKMIELQADRFMNLKYTEEQFRTEALAVKGEYLKNYSNPIRKLLERVGDRMYSKHTYKHTTMGFLEDIEIMPEQMEYAELFFDRWYRPEKTAVVIVGDVDAEAVFALVEQYWGGWKRGDYEADIPVEPPLDGPKYEHLAWDGPTQPWLTMTYRGPAFQPTEKDMPSLDLISSIFFSESSELYQNLVIEEQAVDELFTYFPDSKDPGLLMIAARLTDENNAPRVRDAINATLVKARTALVPEDTVAATKSRLRYAFAARLDSSASIASMLARFVHFSRTPETVNDLYASYDALTAEDLRDAANRYFVDSQRVTVTLSDSATLAGIDGMTSVDELVAAAGRSDVATKAGSVSPPVKLNVAQTQDPVPVSFVTNHLERSSLVDVAFLVHAGAGFDPRGKKGLAALTAAMIADAGSEAMTIAQINEAMYPIAGSFDAQVDKEMTRLSGQVHRDNLDSWYSMVRGQLLFPAWSEADFNRLKIRLGNAIRSDLVNNNDEELGKEYLYAAIYGEDHPYGTYNLGDVSGLAAITLDDVKSFYAANYTISNMTVGLAGGYPEAFAAAISADLQKLGKGQRRTLDVPTATRPRNSKAVVIQRETPAVAVSFGFPIELSRGDPDWVALWLVRSYFGEHRSRNARLFQRIREERGMNYGDYAYIEYFPRGMFQTRPDTNLGRQQQIFQVWIRPLRNNNDAHFATRTAVFELRKLVDEGISESDFETTRAFLAKFVSLLMDGQSRQLGYALDDDYYRTGDFADYIRSGLEKLTLADVNRVIRENLDTENIQYTFVTADADELCQRLLSEQASAMVYEADMPQQILDEDRIISRMPLGLNEESVTVINSSEVFD